MNKNCQTNYNPWMHYFALLTAIVTFLLLGLGGLVTSHEAGMSVPDWPNTYGYNMFLFPISKWVGGVFYEHTHRLLASAVGLLTVALAVWFWRREPRRWLKKLGVWAVVLVIAQGVLGGLRVRWHLDELGIFHGTVAQLFFILVCAFALFTSRWWLGQPTMDLLERGSVSRRTSPLESDAQTTPQSQGGWSAAGHRPVLREEWAPVPAGLRTLVLATTVLIFCQLMLGATMRHQHAGLAIPDFPLAYGQCWPDTSPEAVAKYNAARVEIVSENSITAAQIILQMVHRLMALAILLAVAACAGQAWRQLGGRDLLTKVTAGWLALILAQIGLGIATVLTNKAADIATLHVMVGALSLVTGALWCVISFRRQVSTTDFAPEETISGVLKTQTAMAGNK